MQHQRVVRAEGHVHACVCMCVCVNVFAVEEGVDDNDRWCGGMGGNL
jgi:hypothetical protein